MSWRIEHTPALKLLRELPEQWVQTCIAYPSPALTASQASALFTELRRVMRSDGTLWLLSRQGCQPALDLAALGWLSQRAPWWASPLANGRASGLSAQLFTQHAGFFQRFHTVRPRAPRPLASPLQRPAQPDGSRGARARSELARRCILTSTSPVACGACGAPYEHEPAGVGWRAPRCHHQNARGRCLVLDLFYTPALRTLEVAHANDRAFLAISDPHRRGHR